MRFSTVSFLLLAGCSTGIPHEIRGDVYEVKGAFGDHPEDPLDGIAERSVKPEAEASRALAARAPGDVYEVKGAFGDHPEDPLDGIAERSIDPEEQEEIEMGKGLKGRAIDFDEHPHLMPRAKGEKVQLDQLENESYKKPHAEIALIHAYNKYRKPLPNKKLQQIANNEAAVVKNKLGKYLIAYQRTNLTFYRIEGYCCRNTSRILRFAIRCPCSNRQPKTNYLLEL